MVKVEECNICESKDLLLVEDNPICNPDTGEIEIVSESYVCKSCGCLHVDNSEFSFIQIEIETDKLLQTTDCNITVT
jgi:hypothetical protein